MKLIRTEDAVGSVLCHDITQIIPGVVKDAVFRKGHVVTEEDIPVLLSVGKEHLYVWEKQEGMLHENDAAEILRQVCQGAHMHASEPKEGKIELTAEADGLLKVDRKKLNAVNGMGQMVLASRHGDFPVKKGDKIAGMRVVPLVIEEEKMTRVREICGEEPVFSLLPFRRLKAGIVTTGSEVYHGRIEDKFTPVVNEKLEELKDEVSLEKQVNEDVPRTFLWHTAPDDCVPVENSLLFFQALLEKHIPAELHIFPEGGHGLSLAKEDTMTNEGYGVQEACQNWILLAQKWMESV